MCAKKSCRLEGTLASSQLPSLLSQFSPPPLSLKRCGRDGMRSDSTKTSHNGFDLGPTFRALTRICNSNQGSYINSPFRMGFISHFLSLKSCLLCLVPNHTNKQGRGDPTKLKRKLEPNFRHYLFAMKGVKSLT